MRLLTYMFSLFFFQITVAQLTFTYIFVFKKTNFFKISVFSLSDSKIMIFFLSLSFFLSKIVDEFILLNLTFLFNSNINYLIEMKHQYVMETNAKSCRQKFEFQLRKSSSETKNKQREEVYFENAAYLM